MTAEEILYRVASRVGWEGLSLTKDAYGDVEGLTNGSYTLFARVDEYECIWNIARLSPELMSMSAYGISLACRPRGWRTWRAGWSAPPSLLQTSLMSGSTTSEMVVDSHDLHH